MKHCYLVLRKRRYLCPCGKRFFESYSFLPRYFQRTSRLTAFVASALHSTNSLKTVSEQANISTSTVGRILDSIRYGRAKLGETISIDEFKGNAASEKYQCILVDPVKRYAKLKDEEKQACDLMLLYNDDLRLAHYLKERFFEICQNPKYSEQRTDFFDWIKMAENSGLKEFEDVEQS